MPEGCLGTPSVPASQPPRPHRLTSQRLKYEAVPHPGTTVLEEAAPRNISPLPLQNTPTVQSDISWEGASSPRVGDDRESLKASSRVSTFPKSVGSLPDRMAGKRVLIVFAHEERTSFNYAMLETAVKTLKQNGWEVTVSDLYAMNFNPVASRADVKGSPKNPNHFKYPVEMGHAFKEGRLCSDIVEEQKKLEAADLVIFQFPLYWFGMPAILKGWIDRIFSYEFAYSGQTMYKGLRWQNKKALLSITTGGSGSSYSPSGVHGDMNVVLWLMHRGMLNFCGFQVLEPQISFTVAHVSQEERAHILENWKARLGKIWQEKTISFPPISDFDMSPGGTHALKKDKEKANASEKYGLSVGQHLGKAFPVDSQVKAGSSNN